MMAAPQNLGEFYAESSRQFRGQPIIPGPRPELDAANAEALQYLQENIPAAAGAIPVPQQTMPWSEYQKAVPAAAQPTTKAATPKPAAGAKGSGKAAALPLPTAAEELRAQMEQTTPDTATVSQQAPAPKLSGYRLQDAIVAKAMELASADPEAADILPDLQSMRTKLTGDVVKEMGRDALVGLTAGNMQGAADLMGFHIGMPGAVKVRQAGDKYQFYTDSGWKSPDLTKDDIGYSLVTALRPAFEEDLIKFNLGAIQKGAALDKTLDARREMLKEQAHLRQVADSQKKLKWEVRQEKDATGRVVKYVVNTGQALHNINVATDGSFEYGGKKYKTLRDVPIAPPYNAPQGGAADINQAIKGK